MSQREGLKTSWMYSLKKEELVAYLVQCGQDSCGTVEDMRKRLTKFITTEPEEGIANKLLEWQKLHEQSHTSSPSVSLRVPNEKMEGLKPQIDGETPQSSNSKIMLTTATREDRIATIDLIRKWGLKYDGGKDVLKFVDRLEELSAIYEISLSDIVPVMCELLRDRALIWFRNNKRPWAHWSQFKKDLLEFFLPQRYFEKLEVEIRARTQRPRENFKDFVLTLQELMYHANLSEEEKLEVIFRNSLPDYQWYIKRKDFESLTDLLSLAAELESIPTPRPSGRSDHNRILRGQQTPPIDPTGTTKCQSYLSWEEEKIKATIVFNGQICSAIIDTGATRSFIKPSLLKRMKQNPEYIPTNIEVALADGSKKSISTAIRVLVTFGNMSRNHEFLIMKEATEEIILGLDFLRAFHTTICCAGLSVQGEIANDEPTSNSRPQNKVSKPRLLDLYTSPHIISPPQEHTLQHRIQEFLAQELPRFQHIKGLSTAATHRIIMKDDRPIKIRYAPRNPAMQAIIDEEVNSLLARGCIEPSRSPYSFPITLVKKKNGAWRTCMDFRQLNARSVPDAYPLPRIDTILDRLRNAKYISSLDLKDGYWQIPMHEESKKYTAFAVTGRGLYQWRVMPFGLHSAPATFQRALDNVIGPEMEPHAFAYLDDIIVTGATFEEHLKNLKEVFRRLRSAKLRINPDKCEFFKSEIRYLGHIVTTAGIKTDPEKTAAIAQLPPPHDTKSVRRFLGITSWYRRFVPNFAKISLPLTQLLKKGKHWKWGQEQQTAFETLKEALTKAPVLACPDFTQVFTLQTDASDCGLGAVLTQTIEGTERVIAYASRHLNGAEKNYSATEKECLAIVWGIRKMRQYLEGYEFRVLTDHLSLKWLNSIENPTGRLARWALELQQYKFSIEYRKGSQNIVADALSRHPAAAANLARATPNSSCPWYDKKLEDVRKHPAAHADYTIVSNKLYRHRAREINEEDSTPWKLCVPTYKRQQVLVETHDNVTGGHMGIRKTLNKVAGRYYWPGMARDIARYVQKCETCQRYKVSQQQPAGKMLTRLPDEPWSQVCADFIGPLPRTPHGNTMLLVLFDNFSKWVELVPLRKATAEGVVKALRERIVARYGIPKILITDNGAQFTSRALKRYLEHVGVRQQFTAPYTPQENPTERANRTVKNIIAKFSGYRHNRWDEILPEVMLAVNTSVSESSGYTPAFLTQGRSPRLPKALYDEDSLGTGARCVAPDERAEELKEIFHIVRRNLQEAAQKQQRHYNLRRRHWFPKIGEQVLVRQHPLSKAVENFTAKLAPKFGGPYVITGFTSPVIVQLRAVGSNEKRTAHISDLKPYHPNNSHFSFISHRYHNLEDGRNGERMEASQQKFERTREKFQRNLQHEKEKVRRTIFLQDDELPHTSRGRPRRRQHQRYSYARTQRPERQPVPRPQARQDIKARNFRMSVVNPPIHPTKKGPTDADTIYISDDEDTAPPPPSIRAQMGSDEPREEIEADERFLGETPPPPTWDDQYINSDHFDMDDPFILEFCRTFHGMCDTTVDKRKPTPPSPPSSFSSIDWENENFRPPTPPKRRGFATLEVQDRQYPYLGMQCYERVWQARIMVPTNERRRTITSPLRSLAPTPYNGPALEASPNPYVVSSPTTPPTPGRGWLDNYECLPVQCNLTPSSPRTGTSSPTPSPPPLRRVRTLSPSPTPTGDLPNNPQLSELPGKIREKIMQRIATFTKKRARFIQDIWGQPYRITGKRDGSISIMRI